MIVEGVYAGWAWFGTIDVVVLVMNVVLALRLRWQRLAVYYVVAAALCFDVFFTIFSTWMVPANQATVNWTAMPDDWSKLRQEWEYSHAVNAVVMLIALCSVTLAVITAKQDRRFPGDHLDMVGRDFIQSSPTSPRFTVASPARTARAALGPLRSIRSAPNDGDRAWASRLGMASLPISAA